MIARLANFFCTEEVTRSLIKAGVPANSKWGALILYMRSISEYDFFSVEQKQQMQELVMDIIQKKDYSERRFKDVMRQQEHILYQPWNKKLEQAFLETVHLVEQARDKNTTRTKELKDLQETTISVVTEQSVLETIVSEIRTGFQTMIAHMEQDSRDLVEMSYTDPLTKLNNRRAFDSYFQTTLAEHMALKRPFSLMFLDIDHFKKFNDEYGHRIGDQALVVVGSKLISYAQRYNNISGQFFFSARYGGEEFVVALPGVPLREAAQDAENLRSLIEEYNFIIRDNRGEILQKGIKITVSVGVAELDTDWGEQAGERLFDEADHAMYRAKSGGRNRVCVMNSK